MKIKATCINIELWKKINAQNAACPSINKRINALVKREFAVIAAAADLNVPVAAKKNRTFFLKGNIKRSKTSSIFLWIKFTLLKIFKN